MMQVIKRNGKRESVKFDKITARIQKLSYGLSPLVNVIDVAKKVVEGIYDGVTTTELDNLAAETAASLTTTHPDYAVLASRIAVSNLHKNTIKSFSATMKKMYNYIDPMTGRKLPLLADDVMTSLWTTPNCSTAPSSTTVILALTISVLKHSKNRTCCEWMAKL